MLAMAVLSLPLWSVCRGSRPLGLYFRAKQLSELEFGPHRPDGDRCTTTWHRAAGCRSDREYEPVHIDSPTSSEVAELLRRCALTTRCMTADNGFATFPKHD